MMCVLYLQLSRLKRIFVDFMYRDGLDSEEAISEDDLV
jgi:hypothetical protein